MAEKKTAAKRDEPKPDARPQVRPEPQTRPEPQAEPEPEETGDGEQGTMKIRMANASHGAAYPGDVVEVPEQEGAAILQAWEGQAVAGPADGDDEDDDES